MLSLLSAIACRRIVLLAFESILDFAHEYESGWLEDKQRSAIRNVELCREPERLRHNETRVTTKSRSPALM